MKYNLSIKTGGKHLKVGVEPSLYKTDQRVYELTIGDDRPIIYKKDGYWHLDTDHQLDEQLLQQIGAAIESSGQQP